MKILPRGLWAVCISLAFAPSVVAQESGDDEMRVRAVADAALTAISDEDFVALTDLMVSEAVMFPVVEREGTFTYYARPRSESRARAVTSDIVERGFDGEVRIAGGIATVWLPYDLYVDGEWSHCGVDAFTLLRVGDEWQIASIAWSVEQPPACPRHPDGPPGE